MTNFISKFIKIKAIIVFVSPNYNYRQSMWRFNTYNVYQRTEKNCF